MKIRHLNNDRIQITYYGMDFGYGVVQFHDEIPAVGDSGILGISELADGREDAWLVPDNGEGIGGNTNHEIKRYHGWRGTTNGTATYAHGLRTVIASRETRKTITITLGADEASDRK